MSTHRLKEIRARLETTTPGQWVAVQWFSDDPTIFGIVCNKSDVTERKEDAEFIAAAPEDIRFLLAEVDRLEGENSSIIEGSEEWEYRAKCAERDLAQMGQENARLKERLQLSESFKGYLKKASREDCERTSRLKSQLARIRDKTKCIGLTLCHVDGNCVHCLAAFGVREIEEGGR